MFAWFFERDSDGYWLASDWSDTLGFCIDHSQYRYDSNSDGQVDASDATWPSCASLPLTGMPNAAMFGCVDTALAGLLVLPL